MYGLTGDMVRKRNRRGRVARSWGKILDIKNNLHTNKVEDSEVAINEIVTNEVSTKICVVCGGEYIPKSKNQKYCSKECRNNK